jgi:hypothetical protein
MCAQIHLARLLAPIGLMILSLQLTPASALAQDLPLAQVLPDLVLRDIVLQRGIAGPPHEAHFSPLSNELNNPVVGIVESFNSQMATQFSTFPLGSSSGGTYVFDESVGTFRRGSMSFGPLFAERALTIGRRKLSAGFNYQRTSYNTFEGQNLGNGSIKFYLRHQDCCGFADPTALTGFAVQPDGTRLDPPFEGDLIKRALAQSHDAHHGRVRELWRHRSLGHRGCRSVCQGEPGRERERAHHPPVDVRRRVQQQPERSMREHSYVRNRQPECDSDRATLRPRGRAR